MLNNLGTPSPELQINFGVQIDTENTVTGKISIMRNDNDAIWVIIAQKGALLFRFSPCNSSILSSISWNRTKFLCNIQLNLVIPTLCGPGKSVVISGVSR